MESEIQKREKSREIPSFWKRMKRKKEKKKLMKKKKRDSQDQKVSEMSFLSLGVTLGTFYKRRVKETVHGIVW